MEKVSIIVPVYNAENYLKPCLRSILRQSYREIEVILVNDGSTDDSLAICEKFAARDDRVCVIDIPNGGVSNARNTGIAVASGKYVQFVDSDDRIHPHMVRTMVGELERTQADIVFCGLERVFVKHGRVTQRRSNVTNHLPNGCVLERKAFLNRLPELFRCVGDMEGPCNKMYRRSMIAENGVSFPVDTSFGEDHLFNVQCYARCRRAVFILDVLYYYMQYDQQSLSQKCPLDLQKNQLRLVDVLQNMLEEQIGISESMRKDLEWYRAVTMHGVFWRICAENNGLTREQQIVQLQKLLEDAQYQQAYAAVPPQYAFSDRIEPYIRARDAAGVLATFDVVRAQMRADGKRPVTMYAARKFRAYSEKHPDTRLGKAAQILYLNLATDGIGAVAKRILYKVRK